MPSLATALGQELARLLEPLVVAAGSAERWPLVLALVGHTADVAGNPGLRAALDDLGALANLGDVDVETWDGIEAILSAAARATHALHEIEHAADDPALGERLKQLGPELAEQLTAVYLRRFHTRLFRLAAILGIVDPGESHGLRPAQFQGGVAVRSAWAADELHFDRIGSLLRDPWSVLHAAYLPNDLRTAADAHAAADRMFPLLRAALDELGLASSVERRSLVPDEPGDPSGDGDHFVIPEPDPDDAPSTAPPADLGPYYRTTQPRLTIRIPQLQADGSLAGTFLGIDVAASSLEHPGAIAGLIVELTGALNWTQTQGPWAIQFETDGQVPAFSVGPQGMKLAPLSSALTGATGRLSIARVADGAPAFSVGDPKGTRLELGKVRFGADFSVTPSHVAAGLTMAVDKAVLALAAGDGDGFLASILPADGLKAEFDLGLTLSSDKGLTLRGSAGLEATFPVSVSAAGVTFSAIHVSLQAHEPSVVADVSATVSTSLGPVHAVIERMGIAGALTFPEAGGNLGVADLDLRFKPPKGVGLSLEAGFVKGGGYFFTDPANHEYAGALELQLGKIGVKAIGALTTRPEGWSLILLVYGHFPPIQLSFGFTLNGIGGMIGVQHGVDVTQLILGMKTKAFDDILFPENPVADAPRILNRLRALFPIAPRSLTLGPMVDIGWGTPRIVFIRLGILLQLDNVFGSAAGPVAFTRIVLIGQLRVAIGPTKEDTEVTVIKLVVDILGFWEFDKKRYGFLARLRDSSIAKLDIVGGLGVWGEYGDHPRFLLAAGGFNARFKDVPTDMTGAIDRLGAAFKVGRFNLTLTGYFALTPATLQAGLDLAATAQIGPVGVKGTIGFDVLIYREPDTHFIADFHIIAEVTYKGHSLAGVKVTGTLVGPGLWHLVGELSFSILWWDISKSFDESWGSAPSLSTVQTDVQALLTAELAKRENWSAQLPAGAEAMVTLAPPMGELATLAHPLGRFVFSQCVTPLGLTLERYGSSRITGRNRFDLSSVTAGGQAITARTPVREHFARAQFVETTEEEKLTRPSFEEMDSGVEFSSEAYRVSANAIAADMDYETAYLEVDPRGFNRTRRDPALSRVALDHGLIRALATQGAAARAPQRGRERMRAKTQVRVAVSTAPLAAADRSVFAADSAVPMTGQARTVEMIAEQRFKPKDAARSQLIEEFELA